jgi:hypothetical protein
MRFEDFPFILDQKNGLVCCCVPVTPEPLKESSVF